MALAQWSNPEWDREPASAEVFRLWVGEFLACSRPPRSLPEDSIFHLAVATATGQTVERNAPAP